MNNNDAIQFFSDLATASPTAMSVKITRDGKSDFSKEDANFILQYANKNSRMLDVGSGSGLIVNKICSHIKSICCIEPFCEFSKFIHNEKNITISNCNAFDFTSQEKFDVITFFGIIQYFNKEESISIYKKYKDLLTETGIFIIKNQFGVQEDIIVSGYSEELGKKYFSEYRMLENEIKILQQIGFNHVAAHDIYPPEYSRWTNTHFYALVAAQ